MSAWLMRARTRICTALPSVETADACTLATLASERVDAMMRVSAAWSVASIAPCELTATIVTSLLSLVEPRMGAASDAACELGVLAGRN